MNKSLFDLEIQKTVVPEGSPLRGLADFRKNRRVLALSTLVAPVRIIGPLAAKALHLNRIGQTAGNSGPLILKHHERVS